MEISSQTEQYKQNDLWLKPPFSHLAGIAEQWSKANMQKEGHATKPLDLAHINEDTFLVHNVASEKDSQEEAQKYLDWTNAHKGEFKDLADRDYKIGQNSHGGWEVYWEVQSPYDPEMLQEIRKRHGDYVVSLFSLDRDGLDFTHTANPKGGLPETVKGFFAINKKDNVAVILVEMTEGNKYSHLMTQNLARSEPVKLDEARMLWKTFSNSYKNAGFGNIDNNTKIIVHGQSPRGDKNFFVAEFDSLLA